MTFVPKPAAALPAALLVLALAGCEQQSATGQSGGYSVGSDESIILRVNGKPIPEARVAAYAPPGVEMDEQTIGQVTNNIIVSELLSADALANNLDQSIEVREQLEVARQNVLSRALVNKLVEGTPVSDEEVQQRYNAMVSEMQTSEYNARHILVEAEEEAKEIIAQIEADPAKFGEIAAAQSLDPGSGQNGGQLGWAPPQTYVPEFAAAMQALGKGEFTKEPVRSQFGWHVILVEDIRETNPPALDDQVRQQITAGIQNEAIAAYIEQLRGSAEITEVN